MPYYSDFPYADRPDLQETYADIRGRTFFDGQALRLEFCVARLDPGPQSSGKFSGKIVPACRLVMPPAALFDLHNALSTIVKNLEDQGLLHKPHAVMLGDSGPH